MTPNCPAGQTAQGPLVITSANYGTGVFSGHWVSTDAGVPAVTIATTQPVVLQNCQLSGPGNLVQVTVGGASLTIESCAAIGTGAPGLSLGDFVYAEDNLSLLTVEHCDIENVRGGILPAGVTTGANSMTIRYNFVHNLSGLLSDGGGGFDLTGPNNGAYFVLFHTFEASPNVEVGWNFIWNEPGKSAVTGVISLANVSGTAESPINIHDNFIYGAYPPVATSGVYYSSGISTSGFQTETLTQATGYVNILNNQIVNDANGGIFLYDGHDILASGNRAVSSGFLPGQWPDGGIIATSTGIGIYEWNVQAVPWTIYYNVVAADNYAAWMIATSTPGDLVRNDINLRACDGGCVGNDTLDPFSLGVTTADEAAEGGLWLSKLADAGITIGPVCN